MSVDLSDLNDAYRAIQGGRLSDGVYPAKLVKAEVCRSKAGRRQIVWDLEVQDRTAKRVVPVKKYTQLHPGFMYWLDADLKKLGIALDHINDLHEVLRELAGSVIEIDLETSGDYYVVSFIRPL